MTTDSGADRLAARRVLVTGASSGIGEATVRACIAAGAAVAGVARRIDRLDELAAATGALAIQADLGDEEATARAVDMAASGLGGLDALINCAGIMRLGSIENTETGEWRQMFDVNVFGLLAVTRAAIPALRAAAPADVVNVSSLAGTRVPDAMGGLYGASKSAVNVIGETLRRELYGSGIRVSTVSPGRVETELRDSIPGDQLAARARSRTAAAGLSARAVADVIVRVLADPPEVNHLSVTVLPTLQAMD